MGDRDKVIADLRERYGSDVPVLDQLPTKAEVADRRSRLEFWTGALGYQRGMWRTWDGRLLALIVVPAAIAGHLTFWAPKIEAALEYAEPYVVALREYGLDLKDEFVAFGKLGDAGGPIRDQTGEIIASLAPEVRSLNAPLGVVTASLTLWRVTRRIYPPLEGSGSKVAGGRWTSPGRAVVYAADSPLGAIDEVMFYLRKAGVSDRHIDTADYVLHRIAATGSVEFSPLKLTDEKDAIDWRASRKVGDDWLSRREHPIFAYPSSFAPGGFNYVLDVGHPELVAQVIDTIPLGGLKSGA